MNTIVCTSCGVEIEIDKALEGQIEARVLAAEQHKHTAELEKLKAEAEQANVKARAQAKVLADQQLKGERELMQQQAQAELELAKKKLELSSESARKQAEAEQTALKIAAESAEAEKAQLRSDMSKLMEQLRETNKAKNNAQLDAQKKLASEEAKIREEVQKSADERYRLKIAENEKQLADTQKALEDAQRKAAQGSQQNQGEVLELDLEHRLHEAFPYDEILEVKKGQRGADVQQIVRNQSASDCGMLLWETKNGKWQPAWVAKFKADIREANANIGVIVSQEMPSDFGDMKHLEANVWVVKPLLAPVLASALRATVIQVDAANRNNIGKDAKMEVLYQYVSGPEFAHRIEAVVENYTMLQTEIEKEKRSAVLRWAHQEKAIRAVIDNTYGMYGDLQGITNRGLTTIKNLELDDGLDDEIEVGANATLI